MWRATVCRVHDAGKRAAPEASPAESPAESSPVAPEASTRTEEAAAICEELALEDVIGCSLRDEQQLLPNDVRAELVEVSTEDAMRGETKILVIVLHTPDEVVTSLELAEAYDVPGESLSYEVGAFGMEGDQLFLTFTLVADTFPNTGDPDEPTGETTEREEMIVRCIDDGLWDCAKGPP